MLPYELKMLQTLPLDVKILKTKQRIREWYEYYCGKVYVSFSGGKDSTVLLHLVRSLYPNVQAVFIDTGLEYPEIREFVKTFDNVIWLKPKLPFTKVLEQYGYPLISKEQSHFISAVRNTKDETIKRKYIQGINRDGSKNGFKISNKWKYLLNAPFKISDKCCDIMKKNPAKDYEKTSGNNAIIGTMADESIMRGKVYMQYGCNSFGTARPISTPLGFWTEQDIWDYIKLLNIPYSKIYDMGYLRTGCIFCLYGITNENGIENRFQRLQKTHPLQYKYCMNKLGIADILDYIGVKYERQICLDDDYISH